MGMLDRVRTYWITGKGMEKWKILEDYTCVQGPDTYSKTINFSSDTLELYFHTDYHSLKKFYINSVKIYDGGNYGNNTDSFDGTIISFTEDNGFIAYGCNSLFGSSSSGDAFMKYYGGGDQSCSIVITATLYADEHITIYYR